MKKCSLILTSLLLAIPIFAFSESPAKDPWCGIKIFGYIDASYNYLESNNQFISDVFDREFDIEEDGFTLHQVALSLAYQPDKGLGGLVNGIVGRDAYTTASYGYNPDLFGSPQIGFDVLQAYLQYVTGPLTLIAGKFVCLADVEVVDPTGNANFSRSLKYTFATPITHTGVRGTYVVNDKFKFVLGVNNGWDNIRDTGRDKTIELSVAYTPCPKLSLSAQGYSGEERVVSRTATGPTGQRNLIDLQALYNATDKLALVVNYDYATQNNVTADSNSTEKAIWQGIAGYINYKFNDIWRVSIRGENLKDSDGYRTGVEQTIKDLTLTIGFAPIKNLEFRGETRRDFSNVYSYIDRDSGAPRKTQQSFAVEMLYKFSNS